MDLRLENTRQRRAQKVSFTTSLEKDPRPPEPSGGYFQESYRLEGRIACTFWANSAQLERARKQAEATLRHFLYKDALCVLADIDLAVEEMDQDQLRRACLDMRDIFTGTP